MSQFRDSMDKNASDHMDEAKSRLRDGMDTVRSAASDTREYMNEKYSEVKDRASHLGDDMREQWDHLRDTDYEEVWGSVKDSVRENPGPALLIAGVVGLALGALLAGSTAASTRRRHW